MLPHKQPSRTVNHFPKQLTLESCPHNNNNNMQVIERVVLSEEAIREAFDNSQRPVAAVSDAAPQPISMSTQLEAILHQERPLQHTPEWFQMRMQMLTASNVAAWLGQSRYSSRKRMMNQLYKDLLKWYDYGTVQPRKAALPCQWGTKHEAEAAVLYQLVTGNRCFPDDLGLVIHHKLAFLGASPDRALVDRPVLVEIKAPWKRQIIPEELPSEYVAQVQTQLEVCDMEECHFVQFRPASLCEPGTLSVLLVKRDREWWKKHEAEIHKFPAEMALLKARVEKERAATLGLRQGGDEEERPAKRQRIEAQQQQQDKTVADDVTLSPSSTKPSKPAAVELTTCSPGVYNVYIDKRIKPSAQLLNIS